MSRRRKTRRTVRWARYVNHYAHIPAVQLGGHAAWRAISPWDPAWVRVRRQAKRRVGGAL